MGGPGDLLGVPGHGWIARIDVCVEEGDGRCVEGPVRKGLGGGQLGQEKEDLDDPDEDGAGGEKIAAPQHGRDQRDPCRDVDEWRHRVEDGEGLEVVPGDETQEGEGGKRPDHGPQKHSQGEGQASAPPSPRVGRGPDVRITARHRGSVRHRRLVGVSALEPGRLRRRGGGGPASAGSAR